MQSPFDLLTAFWSNPAQLGMALRWITIVGLLTAAAFGAAGYFVNDRIGALQAALITAQGENLRDQGETLERQSKTITDQSAHVTKLTDELTNVKQHAIELARKAQDAARGISDTYDFNGTHRQGLGGGRTDIEVGGQAIVFQTIMQLSESKSWIALGYLCEEQIKKTPEWLTPYLFSGIASANLGDFSLAEERLQFVVSNAGDDPQYADAKRILSEISSRQRH